MESFPQKANCIKRCRTKQIIVPLNQLFTESLYSLYTPTVPTPIVEITTAFQSVKYYTILQIYLLKAKAIVIKS